jgi:hypothetical protein
MASNAREEVFQLVAGRHQYDDKQPGGLQILLSEILLSVDFRAVRGEASRESSMRTATSRRAVKRAKRPALRSSSQVGERYTPRRLAQFLLQNAVGAADYAAARREVKKLGLKPDTIPHDRPTDV